MTRPLLVTSGESQKFIETRRQTTSLLTCSDRHRYAALTRPKGKPVKVQVGDWVLFTPHIVAVQHLQAGVQAAIVHLPNGGKYYFAGDEAEALLSWARDGASNLIEIYPPTGQMKEAAKNHFYDWNGVAA